MILRQADNRNGAPCHIEEFDAIAIRFVVDFVVLDDSADVSGAKALIRYIDR
jgi:hypothetical protein